MLLFLCSALLAGYLCSKLLHLKTRMQESSFLSNRALRAHTPRNGEDLVKVVHLVSVELSAILIKDFLQHWEPVDVVDHSFSSCKIPLGNFDKQCVA